MQSQYNSTQLSYIKQITIWPVTFSHHRYLCLYIIFKRKEFSVFPYKNALNNFLKIQRNSMGISFLYSSDNALPDKNNLCHQSYFFIKVIFISLTFKKKLLYRIFLAHKNFLEPHFYRGGSRK